MAAAQASAPAAAAPAGDASIAKVQELAALHAQGVLSDEEFVSPLINQPDQRLYIFGGVVATDCYPMNVNLPFVVNCNKLKGSTFTLCKGEPIAVVIPFWREQWRKLVITRGDRGKSGVEHGKTVLSIFLRNAYRKYWRKVSNYKMV